LVGIVLLTLLGFSAFFVGFLLAPLAVLGFFALLFYSRNRTRAARGSNESTESEASEAEARSRLIRESRERHAALTRDERRERTYEDVPPPRSAGPAPKTVSGDME
jgi:ABC-type multidrug transport system fused ATPase/permease subunit